MKVQCPHCKSETDVPKLYINTEINCTQCKKCFVAVAYLPAEIRMAAIESVPYLLLCSLLGYPFVAWSYAHGYPVMIKYTIVISALTGLMILGCRSVRRKWPLLRKPAKVVVGLLCLFLLYTYAKNDSYMEHHTEGDYKFYDKYRRWGFPNLIHRSIYFYEDIIAEKKDAFSPFIHWEGPMAARPGQYISKRHGMWEESYVSRDINSNYTKLRWYWYGEEITEGQWLQRTER